jgi:hypothetical protein
VLLHYMGGRWTRVDLPNVPGRVAIVINGLTMVSLQEGWTVGAGWLPPVQVVTIVTGWRCRSCITLQIKMYRKLTRVPTYAC